jgi:hypothetical protein
MARFHFCVPVMSSVMARGRWDASDAPGGGSVEATLDRCLKSLLNQSERDFMIHLAAHELPPLHVADPQRIAVHSADFPRPPDINLDMYNQLAGKVLDKLPDVRRRRIGDKYSKLKINLSAALADPEAQWVMFVDSDDLVHRDVVAHALAHDGEWPGGHTVTRGYSWRVGEDSLREVNGFHKICGTCNVVRLVQWEKDQFAATHSVNTFERKTHWLFAGHASVFKRLRNTGRDTAKLPFRAAIYVTGTGFNYSGIKQTGSGQVPLTDELKHQFGIE